MRTRRRRHGQHIRATASGPMYPVRWRIWCRYSKMRHSFMGGVDLTGLLLADQRAMEMFWHEDLASRVHPSHLEPPLLPPPCPLSGHLPRSTTPLISSHPGQSVTIKDKNNITSQHQCRLGGVLLTLADAICDVILPQCWLSEFVLGSVTNQNGV